MASKDGTNQPMGEAWDCKDMYSGATLKKFDGLTVADTAHEDGDGKDDGATAPLGLEEDGDGGVDDAAVSSQDDASEDSDDGIVLFGHRAVQVLAIRANFPICCINGYDCRMGRRLYIQDEGKVQEEGMVDLVPTGPGKVLWAYGAFGLEVFHPTAASGNTAATGEEGRSRGCTRITKEWDACGDDEDNDDDPHEHTQTVCGGPGRELEITYLVIPNAVETNVEVKLKLKDLGSKSRAVYGEIKASSTDYGNRSVHLFRSRREWSWSVPSGSTSILPLSPSVIALPYRRQLELHIEVDLKVITISDDNQEEEEKNLRFTGLKFTRRIRSQQRGEIDEDQVEVNITLE